MLTKNVERADQGEQPRVGENSREWERTAESGREHPRVGETGRRSRWMDTTRRAGGTDYVTCPPHKESGEGKEERNTPTSACLGRCCPRSCVSAPHHYNTCGTRELKPDITSVVGGVSEFRSVQGCCCVAHVRWAATVNLYTKRQLILIRTHGTIIIINIIIIVMIMMSVYYCDCNKYK